jgi:DNA-binding transcriptional LysR family regulator
METISRTNDTAPRPVVTLEQLHTFVAVARHEHVTRAAETIHLSQGAVSQQLMLLERALGVQLFERTGRRLRLTDAGRRIQETAIAALASVNAVEETAAAYRRLDSGRIRIAASNTTGIYRLPEWIAGFADRHPHVEITMALVNTAEAISRLRSGAVDCAVVEGPFDDTGLRVLTLEQDELVITCAASHPLAELRRLSAGDLARYRYLCRESGSGTEELAARLLGDAYRLGPVLEFGQADVVHAAVRAGLGYAVLSRAIVNEDAAAGRLVILRLGERTGLRREFRAVVRATSRLPSLEALWQHLADFTATTVDADQTEQPRSS